MGNKTINYYIYNLIKNVYYISFIKNVNPLFIWFDNINSNSNININITEQIYELLEKIQTLSIPYNILLFFPWYFSDINIPSTKGLSQSLYLITIHVKLKPQYEWGLIVKRD